MAIFRKNGIIPASYIIYIDNVDGLIKARDSNGVVQFSGSDAATVIQNTINSLTNGGIFIENGTYTIDTTVTLKSNVSIIGESKSSTILRRTVTGDILSKSNGISGITIQGIEFDLTGTGWSGVDLVGSDAISQVSDITIRDCKFKNPSTAWLLQISYTIVDPAIPSSKNYNIRIEDCEFDSAGQTSTLETVILVNSKDVIFDNCRFINVPATLGAALAIYGYNRYVKIVNCHFQDFVSKAVYITQSDNISFINNSFKTSSDVECIVIFNNQYIDINSNFMEAGSSGVGIRIRDFSSTTFDGHTNLYNFSTNIKVQGNIIMTVANCVDIDVTNVQGQTDIFVIDNFVSPLRSLFYMSPVPESPSGTIKRINISNNHIINQSAFDPSGCIDIVGNASAPNGGIQTILIKNNLIPASGAGGGAYSSISIRNLADDVLIEGNRVFNPITVNTNVTNLTIRNNKGYITENNVLSGTFAIDSIGVKTVTIPHSLAITPAVQDCHLTVVQNTAVDDWTYNILKVASVNAKNVVAKIKISTRSATAGATAKLGLRVGNP